MTEYQYPSQRAIERNRRFPHQLSIKLYKTAEGAPPRTAVPRWQRWVSYNNSGVHAGNFTMVFAFETFAQAYAFAETWGLTSQLKWKR